MWLCINSFALQLSQQQTQTILLLSGTPVSNPTRCPTHTNPILTDRLLPAEPGRVIGIQDHLDDRGGWPILVRRRSQPFMACRKFPETHGPPFAQRERAREGERFMQRVTAGRGRDCFACSELAAADPRDTLSLRGKQLSMHEQKSPSGLCCILPG